MNVEIAERLAARRKEAGLSQEGLAEKLGVSRQAVSKWERSESSPDTDNLIALAKLYGVSLDDLLYVDGTIEDDVAFEAADRARANGSGAGVREAAGAGATMSDAQVANANASAAGAQGAYTTVAGASTQGANADAAGARMPGDAAAHAAAGVDDNGDKHSKVKIGLGGIHVLDGEDYVHVSWRDGVHVHDSSKGDEVHVGWDGIHVKAAPEQSTDVPYGQERNAKTKGESHCTLVDSGGDEVIIDGDGVVINGEHFDSWRDAHERYGYGSVHDGRWNEPCGYTVCGERFDTLEEARAKYGSEVGKSIPVRKHYLRAFEKTWCRFPYPLVVILAYLLLGIFQGAWGVGLFLFFTIPLYYMVGHAIGRRRLAPLIEGAYPICAVAWFFYMAFVLNAWHPAWVIFLTIPLVEWLTVSLSRWYRRRKCEKAAADAAPIEVEVN